ncbi:MAG: hypothetical protein FJY29_03360 [Betaproteobacteria bacterium]|nr:hypothetical protein [Betaproteobacteria bacterium]
MFLFGAACVKKPASAPQQPSQIPAQPPSGDAQALPQQLVLGSYVPLSERTELTKKIPDASLVDAWFALAVCDCLPALQTSLTTSLNTNRGALPQALTPAIRTEILGNPKLKILEIVPRPIDNIVGGIFADEVTVADEVSKALLAKINVVEKDWSPASGAPRLHLDAFVPLPGTKELNAGRWTQLADVWSRWALVFSQGGPWSNLRNTSTDKGYLWLELLRVLAEGEYLFGLGGDGKGNQWGGLTLPVDLQIINPGAFDPRQPFNQVRFLTGFLDLTLPSNNSLSLARFGGEKWSWRNTPVPLVEQALQWWTAARMLHRLRPANRGIFSQYYLPGTLLPDEGYQIALLVLPGIDSLLGGRFIDENTRAIQGALIGAQVGVVSQAIRSKANPQALSTLLLALSEWSQELSNVNDLQVSSETTSQLKAAPRALQRGAQLIVQTLLAEHLRARVAQEADSPATPWTLVSSESAGQELPLRDHAQVLAALITAERSVMPSPYLRGRIVQLANGLAQRQEQPAAATTAAFSLTEALWLKSATSLFLKHFSGTAAESAVQKMETALQQKLDAFERSTLP